MLDDLLTAEAAAYEAVSSHGLGEELLGALPRARRVILERLLSAVTCEGIPLRGIAAPLRPVTLTGRQVLDGPVTKGNEEIIHPVRAADLLNLGETVEAELEDSVSNYALALTGAHARRARMRDEEGAAATTLSHAREQGATDPAFSPLAFFEQWVIDGHPLQANAKIKLGLSPEDAIRYSPEWGACLTAPVAALPAERVRDMGMTALIREQHDLNVPAGHALVPLHPWQAARLRFPEGPLEGRGIGARPLMSFRTLAPLPRLGQPYPAHLKTAVGIQLTGAIRGVSAAAAENGPHISRLMREILDREDGFGGRIEVLTEQASCHVEGTLGAIARVNPEEGLAPGELIMPVAALYAASPLTDGPILAEVLKEHQETARRFAAHYAELTVEPLLTLLLRYGVALEAHPQNTLVVVRDGLPVRLVVRDLGAIRLDRDRLSRQGLSVRLRAGSAVSATGFEEARNKLYFSFFVNHLGELIACLGETSGLPQGELWEPFADRAGMIAGAETLFQRPLPMKRMLSMRLSGAVTDETFVDAPNPMRRSS